MEANYVILQIELGAIKNFLEHVDTEAGTEIEDAFRKNHMSEFDDVDNFDNALFNPVIRQEIAARAVYYELNALIERELCKFAYEPWLESTKHCGPKLLDYKNDNMNSIRSLKTIEDLPFGKIISLIEEEYKI